MVFLRIVGLLLGLMGMTLLLMGIVFGEGALRNVPMVYALFAILVGLLLAVGANAGERMSQKQKAQKAKKDKKPEKG
jgi:membrane protein implicated in regulation of membrane protease activity